MDPESQQLNEQNNALSLLSMAIEALNLAKEISAVTPAKAVFGSVGALLAMIRVPLPPSCDDELPIHMHPGFNG